MQLPLDNHERISGPTAQQIVRFCDDTGVEYVQLLWRGKPASKPWLAWMWDAWDEESPHES
jgi:hypothetical protein